MGYKTVRIFLIGASGFLSWGIPLQLNAQCTSNPIVCENTLTGNLQSEWDVSGVGDASIQGFATDISVNKGQTVAFKIDTTASAYRIDIYRLGYYGGRGARKVATINPSASLPQNQPACVLDPASGALDCGTWGVSASWSIPANAVSGVYIARLVRTDTGGASHIIFIVRDDSSTSELLFQTSDTTWQAYNLYGNGSLYGGTGPGEYGRCYKVSYNRPFVNRTAGIIENNGFLWDSEYPMIRWLEANGYNVTYASGVDTDRRGSAPLKQHKVFLSVGHDEYWSAQQRANVENARDAGIHLGFFSGNEMYWKTRWENSIAGPSTSYRTLVCYKETHANARIDPTGIWTGTWRDTRFSPPADGGRPENAVTGQFWVVNAFRTDGMSVPANEGKLRFWRNTGLNALQEGQSAQFAAGILGYEWDEVRDNGLLPPGLIRMSSTTIGVDGYILDFGTFAGAGIATHNLSLYRHNSGALVFGAGTIRWSWGLSATHDLEGPAPDARIKQATVNLFADMGVQPVTLESGIAPATQSTDTIPPTSLIKMPPGGIVPAGIPATISGTATDTGGGRPAGVEFSLDGGTTWHPAKGGANWSATWTADSPGLVTIKSRATDDSGRIETPGPGITVNVIENPSGYTIWPRQVAPTIFDQPDLPSIELGVRFRSDQNGWIKALRFYKCAANTGVHVGHLWANDGTLLATVPFTHETATGWQEEQLPTPVPITAGIPYVASYHLDSGHFSADAPYFSGRGVDQPPLHAYADGAAGPNGLFHGGESGFPTDTWNSANYWVDVVYSPSMSPDTAPPIATSVTPANGTSGISPLTSVSAQFNEGMAPWTISSSNYSYPYPNGLFSFSPTVDSAHQNMLKDFKIGHDLQFTLTQVPNGIYDVYVWTFEDNNSLAATVSVEGNVVKNYTSGSMGHWDRLGPFTTTVSDGDIQVRVQSPNDVALVSGVEVWQTGGLPPAPPPPSSSFFRAINLGGPAMTMDGHNWEANTVITPDLAMNTFNYGFGVAGGNIGGIPGFVFNPPVDTPEHAEMLRTYRWQHDVQFSLTNVPNGLYNVYVWTFEPNSPLTVTLSIEQNIVLPTYSTGPPGHWDRLGPFLATVDDGNIQVRFECIDPNSGSFLSGVEVWQLSTPLASQAGTFYRAINVGGPAMTIDGHNWEGEGTSNYRFNNDPYPFSLKDPQGNVVPATVTYDIVNQKAQLHPSTPLNNNTSYIATLKGGSLGITDLSGNGLTSDVAWTFLTGTTQPFQAAPPTFSPAGGTYSVAQSVTISDTSAGVQIYYTTNGSTPTTSSTLYAAPVTVGSTTTIKAIAAGAGWLTSNVASSTYTIQSTTPPTAPSSLGASAASATQVNLSWTDNSSNESSFLIERKTGSGGTFAQIGSGPANVTTYNDTTVAASTTYVYRVRAANTAGNSAYSNEATATTPAVPSVPPPWAEGDVGATGLTGSAVYSNGAFTVKASGTDIWDAVDAFHFVYQPMTGDGTIVARVASIQNTSIWAKAGVMIRESLAANSKHAMMVVTPGSGVSFQRRVSTGGLSTDTTSGGKVAPYWVGLVRNGNSFSAYYSSNGSSWTQIGSATISMSSSVQIGLAVTSHNNSVRTTAVIDNVAVATQLAPPSALSAVATSSTQINLSWTDNASNETGFKIERKTGSGGTYAQIATVGANVTTYPNTGLAAGTTYFYRVRATNASADSAYSGEASATTPIPAPAAPGGLTAATISSSQINLVWTDVAGEAGYKIERKTGSGGAYSQIATVGADVVSYSSTGLGANTIYFYRVRATNAGGDSGYSNEANATTLNAPPAAPGNLSASAVSTTQINLSWTDNASNETGFKIERKTGSSGTYSEIATVGAGSASYNDTGLSVATAYYYRVRATNSLGDSAYSNEANATTLSNIPAAPSNLTATATSSSQINLTWTDNASNESGFEIERKTGGGGSYSQIVTVGTGVTSYGNTGLSSGTTYYYRVRAINSNGASTYSNEANATPASVPSLRAATANEASAGSLTISKPSGTQQGDVLVAAIAVRPSSATINISGWTLVRRINNSNSNSNALAVYYKVAGSSEPSSYTWSFSTSTGAVGGIRTFININTSTPVDVESGQNTGNGTSHSAPGVTTHFANDMIVTSHSFSSSARFTPPSGMTEAFDIASESIPSSGGEAIEGNYQVQTSVGSTGSKTATASNDADVGNAHTLALKAR